MNPANLIHMPEKIHSALAEVGDRLIVKQPMKVYIPARFIEKRLCFIGNDVRTLGIFAIVLDDKFYCTSLVNAMMPMEPTSYRTVKINQDEYLELDFAAGAALCSNLELVQDDVLVYKIYNEILSKAHIPWFINYFNASNIFDSASYHGGANIGKNQEVTELIVSILARQMSDRRLYYRTGIESFDDILKNPVAWIGMRSVQFAATNTVTKLGGSYFSDGLNSALVNPAERTERIESLLRK